MKRALESVRCARGRVQPGPQGAADAGRLISDALTVWGLAADVFGTELAVASLVSTSERPCALRLQVRCLTGRVRIDLAPTGSASGARAWPPECWSIRLVDRIADEVGLARSTDTASASTS